MTASERAPTVAGLILRGNAAAAAITAIGCVLALLAAWFVPGLAILVIWPLLFVVPGWALVAWAEAADRRHGPAGIGDRPVGRPVGAPRVLALGPAG